MVSSGGGGGGGASDSDVAQVSPASSDDVVGRSDVESDSDMAQGSQTDNELCCASSDDNASSSVALAQSVELSRIALPAPKLVESLRLVSWQDCIKSMSKDELGLARRATAFVFPHDSIAHGYTWDLVRQAFVLDNADGLINNESSEGLYQVLLASWPQ